MIESTGSEDEEIKETLDISISRTRPASRYYENNKEKEKEIRSALQCHSSLIVDIHVKCGKVL